MKPVFKSQIPGWAGRSRKERGSLIASYYRTDPILRRGQQIFSVIAVLAAMGGNHWIRGLGLHGFPFGRSLPDAMILGVVIVIPISVLFNLFFINPRIKFLLEQTPLAATPPDR